MINLNSLELVFNDLTYIKESFYDKNNVEFSHFIKHEESSEYAACSFKLNSKKIEYRNAKITPKKIGQFVTVWQRNKYGITESFNENSLLDFIIITVRDKNNLGQFIFPKSVLLEYKIISSVKNAGKRGFRVYPSWEKAHNAQAIKTQNWQLNYFIILENPTFGEVDFLKQYLSIN